MVTPVQFSELMNSRCCDATSRFPVYVFNQASALMVRRRAGGASGLVAFVFLAWASQRAAEAAETCSARGFGLQLCSDCEIFAQHVRSSKGKRGKRERTCVCV